ncbi:MucR family transcriptional regulator [Methylorubrum rhodesianum]|uniref:MucR family transcriptional regulator n=1 Tax=Methylorubrum TaxID=2282523 RepID=UPI00160C163A|nr:MULTISPECIES: MucR family transcriptional regulator [Methylorubrum]MBB5765674.1 putative transcriptional regulator [Methylorubrum rhodesianum]MBI1691553.1 MucR family transcriptional regulator [Methylorubrum sp. DB1722]
MSNDTTEAAYANAARVDLAVEIVMAYVGNNVLPAKDLPGLIGDVHAALAGLGSAAAPASAEPEDERPTPAQIKKSITPDAIISFIDGKRYKTLKRHLGLHGLDPYSYRARYGLPADYPMVAPNYAARRSELAKSMGLGQLRRHWPAKAAAE